MLSKEMLLQAARESDREVGELFGTLGAGIYASMEDAVESLASGSDAIFDALLEQDSFVVEQETMVTLPLADALAVLFFMVEQAKRASGLEREVEAQAAYLLANTLSILDHIGAREAFDAEYTRRVGLHMLEQVMADLEDSDD